MKVPFRELPGHREDVPRPMLDVWVQGIEHTPLTSLADTGTVHYRFAAWIARHAGIDLSDVPPESVGVGGRPVIARTVTVGLALGDHSWEAPVSFCEPWPWDFQLLGQEGFFRYFHVVFEAGNRMMIIRPQK